MIEDIITRGTAPVDSDEAVQQYEASLQTLSSFGDELRANEDELKKATTYTDDEKSEAGWLTNFYGYSSMKDYDKIRQTDMPITTGGVAGWIAGTIGSELARRRPVDETFSLDEKLEKLREAKVDPTQWEEFTSASNRRDFDVKVGRHFELEKAIKVIESMPITEALAYSALPAALDVSSWAVGAGVGKVVKVAGVAAKFSGLGAKLLNAAEAGIVVGSATGASEYLIQKENSVDHWERVEDAALFGAALGSGISLLPAVGAGLGSVTTQAINSKGIQNTLVASGVQDFVRKHLVLNPVDQLLTSSTATQTMKDWAKKADTLLFAERDVNGNIIASPAEVGMGYREHMTGKIQNVIQQQLEEAHTTGKSLSEIDALQHSLMSKFVNESRLDAGAEIVKLTLPERMGLYQVATGEPIKVGKNGKFVIPTDFYNVLENSFLKEGKASGKYVIPKEVAHISKFFNDFQKEGDLLKQRGLAGKEGEIFLPRGMNREVLLSDRLDSITKIEEMMAADPLNSHLIQIGELSTKELKDTAIGIYDKALETDMAHRYLSEGAKTGVTSTRMRALRMDTSLYPDLFSKSLQRTVAEYGDNMAGKLAANKFYGLTGGATGNYAEEMRTTLLNFAKEGASEKDVANLSAILETIFGTRKFQNNPQALDQWLTRMTKKSAGALYSAGFSRYSLAELGAIMAKQGVVSTLEAFIPAHKMMLDVIKGSASTNPILQLFNDMGVAGQYLKGVKNDKFDTLALQHNVGTVEKALDDVNYFGKKISFFAQLQDILDFTAGGAHFNEVLRLSKDVSKITTAQESRMARYSLSKEDITAIGKENIIYGKNGTTVTDYNLANWADKDLAKKFHFSLQHAVRDTVVRTDGTRIHRALSDNKSITNQLLFQYMQFPSAAFERLLLNMEEVEARTAVGVMTSTMIMYGMNDLMDAAQVQLGVKDKRHSTEDLILKSVLQTPFGGVAPSIYDTIASGVGLTTSSGYTPSTGTIPSGAGIGAIAKSVKYTGMTIKDLFEGDYKKAFTDMSHNVPIANSYTFGSIGFKALAGQTVKNRDVIGNPISGMNDTTDSALLRILGREDTKDESSFGLGTIALGAGAVAAAVLSKGKIKPNNIVKAVDGIKPVPPTSPTRTASTTIETNAPTSVVDTAAVVSNVDDMVQGALRTPSQLVEEKLATLPPEDIKAFQDMSGKSNNLTEALSKFDKYLSIKDKRTVEDFAPTGTQYHGTSSKVSEFSEQHFTESNIYGDGFYTTSKPSIAASYTKKGKGKEPTLYEVVEKTPSKTLDLETTPAIDAIDSFPKELEIPDGASLREAIDLLRDSSRELGLPKYEIMEYIDNIQKVYQEKGYNSWSHSGGLKTYSEGHYVKIYFNPKEDIILKEVNK